MMRSNAGGPNGITRMLPNYPKDHHFIPAFFLAEWADADGKLLEYSIRNGGLVSKRVGPRGTGFERFLYTFPELPRDIAQFIEQSFFDYADRTAHQALQTHLGLNTQAWTGERISAWSRFVVALHMRHPDAMPEFRDAAQSMWDASKAHNQARHEALRSQDDPATFEEYVALKDPLIGIRVQVNMIIKAFDNEILGHHVNNMQKGVLDVSRSPHRFLLSDRPVCFANLSNDEGMVSLPISPTKLFVGVNKVSRLQQLAALPSRELVHNSNRFVVGRARRYVWAQGGGHADFIQKHISTQMEPTPLFPGLGMPGRADRLRS
jgi:hypothetical protein